MACKRKASNLVKPISQSSGNQPFVVVHEIPTLTLSDLPYEILVQISRKVPSCDIIKGLSGRNRRLHEIFRDEQYWKERIRGTWPQLYEHGLRGLELLPTYPDGYWMKRAYHSDRLQRIFSEGLKWQDLWQASEDRKLIAQFCDDGNADNADDGEDFGGMYDETAGMCNLSCLTFCDQGKILVMADSQNGWLLYWNLQSNKPMKPHASSVKGVHSNVINSIRSQGNLISTGSSDSTLAIVDLKNPCRPTRKLKTGQVLSHAWQQDLIAVGTDDGMLSLHDVRAPNSLIAEMSTGFDDFLMLDGNDVQMNCSFVYSAGWIDDRRTARQYDLRTLQLTAEATVPDIVKPQPSGHWGAKTRFKAVTSLHEGQYWIGAESGKIFEFDAKSLALVKDHSSELGHTTHISGIHATDGHLVSLSRSARAGQQPLHHRAAVHTLRDKASLVWEQKVPIEYGLLPIMAFADEQSAIAVAQSDSVFLWRCG